MTDLLTARDVRVVYNSRGGPEVTAVRDASLTIARAAAFGIIGESGSGKTSLARVIAGLTPATSGSILFDGAPLLQGHPAAAFRRAVQFMYQDSASALNPRMQNWKCATEPAHLMNGLIGEERRALAHHLFERLSMPLSALDAFPHALSGGQRQRLALARALSTSPRLIILDEPTSALDATIQAAILDELLALNLSGVALLLISHDVAVVRQLCTEVAIMQAGQIIEQGTADEVLVSPRTAYGRRLIAAANT